MILVEAPSVAKVLPMEFQKHRRIKMSEEELKSYRYKKSKLCK